MIDFSKSHDRLLGTIDKFIDRYEAKRSVSDAKLDSLLEWAKEVSKKTGIPLKDL